MGSTLYIGQGGNRGSNGSVVDSESVTVSNIIDTTYSKTITHENRGTAGPNGYINLSIPGSTGITFNGTVNSASSTQSLSISTAGQVNFNGAVGTINALSSLSVSASSTITPATIQTTGIQDYTGAVNLGANTNIITTSNGSVTFNGTVDAPGSNSLTINTGTSSSAGAVVFSNAVGATNAVAGLTVTAGNVTSLAITSSSGMTMNSADTANGITLSGLIKNTGGTGTGIVVEAVGNVLLTGVTNSGSLGIKVTGGKGIAAGTTAGGNIKDLGTVTNTAGNIAISMATPTSGTVSAGQPGSPEYQIGLTTTNAALGTNVTYNQAGGSYAVIVNVVVASMVKSYSGLCSE